MRIVKRLTRGMFRPFGRFGRSARKFFLGLVQRQKVGALGKRMLSFPTAQISKAQYGALGSSKDLSWAEKLNPLSWVGWSFRFFTRWIATRPYGSLLLAIPAVIVVAVLLGAIIVFVRRDQDAVRTQYERKLALAIRDDDTAVQAVSLRRLLQLSPYSKKLQFQLALSDFELGREDAAKSAIFRLATSDQHGPSALWLMAKIMEAKDSPDNVGAVVLSNPSFKKWTEQDRLLFQQLSTTAISNLPQQLSVDAKKLYAEFLAITGATGNAIDLYEEVAKTDPSVYLIAAQLAANTSDYERAKRLARPAIRFLEPLLRTNASSANARLNLARALVLDDQDTQAFKILVEGMQVSNDPILRQAAGDSLVFSAERLKREKGLESSLLERIQLLVEAVKYAPKSSLVVDHLVRIAIECRGNDNAIEQIHDAMAKGVRPDAMHFVIGTMYLMDGKHDLAEEHLGLAMDKDAGMFGVLNNLAVVSYQKALSSDSATTKREKLDEALRFVDQAMTLIPRNHEGAPFVYETRGQILLAQGKHKEAISDLEKALPEPRIRYTAHQGLEAAYRALGLDNIADRHKQLKTQFMELAQ